MIAAFEKLHPDVTVNYVQFSNDAAGYQKLTTALQGGVNIDVFFSYGSSTMSQYKSAGLAMDLTDKVNGVDQLKPLLGTDPQLIPLYDGHVYGVPTAYNPYMVYLNQDMFAKAGVAIPDTWTIDEFHQTCLTMVKNGSAKAGTYKSLSTAVMTLGGNANYTADGKASNFQDPAWVQQYDLMLAMENDGSLMSEKQILAQKLSTLGQSLFLTGQHPLYLDNIATTRVIQNVKDYPHDFKTVVRALPTIPGVSDPWNYGGISDFLQIASNTKSPDMAWEFVKFWAGDGAQYMLRAGKVPPLGIPTTQAEIDAMVPGLLGADRDKLFDVDSFTKVAFDTKVKCALATITTAQAEISTIVSGLTQEMLLGKRNVADTLAEMKKQSDEAITKDSK